MKSTYYTYSTYYIYRCTQKVYVYIGGSQKNLPKKHKWRRKFRGKIYRKKIEAREIIRQHVAAQLGLATTPPHLRQCLPLPDTGGRSASSASSIPELHPHQFHHIACTSITKVCRWYPLDHQCRKTLLWGPEMVRLVGGTAREMVGALSHPTSTGFFDGLHHWYSLVVWECRRVTRNVRKGAVVYGPRLVRRIRRTCGFFSISSTPKNKNQSIWCFHWLTLGINVACSVLQVIVCSIRDLW